MTVAEAKVTARKWVEAHASEVPRLTGVFTASSMNWLPKRCAYDPSSDIDLYHVTDGEPDPSLRMRMLFHQGGVLQPSYKSERALRRCADGAGIVDVRFPPGCPKRPLGSQRAPHGGPARGRQAVCRAGVGPETVRRDRLHGARDVDTGYDRGGSVSPGVFRTS